MLLILGQKTSILQLGWLLLSLVTVEERPAGLVEAGNRASKEVLKAMIIEDIEYAYGVQVQR